jgi:hypothetical protein
LDRWNYNVLNRLAVLAAAAFLSLPVAARADEVQFNRDVRPILSDKCFACHGLDAKHRKAKLRLDTPEGAFGERKGRRAVVAGDISKSELWARITTNDEADIMPPPDSHKKITPAEREILKKWIEQGAKYQKHWSFEPLQKPEVPRPAVATATVRNPIDAFILARLDRQKLQVAAEADRPTLIRRAAFALTGLPPTPDEVAGFVADPSADAYEKVVDRYLASPRYGEEMARHWLDVARYADTHGLHLDNERSAWGYRDYVIDAFNKNKPFDQFTIEQLAGDQLPRADKPSPTVEQLTATGFSRCNVTTSEGGSIESELLYRYAVDRTSTTMETFLGLTGQCAVCHDHKFDPISAKEFYSLYAFFNSAADPGFDGNVPNTAPVTKLITSERAKKLAEFDAQITAKQKEVDERKTHVVYTDPATVEPRPLATEAETVWVDDEFPKAGKTTASPGHPTTFAKASDGAPVYSGNVSVKRTDKGLAQDVNEGPEVALHIPAEARIFAYVYIDPKDPPKAIMLQLHGTDGTDWNHRAVWGDHDSIPFGDRKTKQKVSMGKMPKAGEWLRLEFPADKINLAAGDIMNGIALTQFGGTVYWDKVGVIGRSDAAGDPTKSMLAWQRARVGKETPTAPPEVAKLLKEGPEKVKNPDGLKRLREYYVQQVCTETKKQFEPMATELVQLRQRRAEFDGAIPVTFTFADLPKPRDSFIMLRGDYTKPGEKVEPGTPAALPALKKADPNGRATRLDLAKWLVEPENPLTARVATNRLWQQFFGTGLVKSSGDFGSQGEPPSHPDLLDWLASEYRQSGWDTKKLVRMLVTSATFREASAVTPELLGRDPENRLLARGPRFRLDAEQIRDNALFVSGLMNLTIGGKGVRPYQPPNIWEPVGFVGSNTRFYTQDKGDALYRRSIYTFLKRTAPPPFMANFDAPSREASCTRRERSNTPLQALQLMNDVQHVEAARALAERMITQGGSTADDRITFAYKTVLARSPEAEERQIVGAQLASHIERYAKDAEAAKKLVAHGESKPNDKLAAPELAAYTLVANTILNLDETLTRN